MNEDELKRLKDLPVPPPRKEAHAAAFAAAMAAFGAAEEKSNGAAQENGAAGRLTLASTQTQRSRLMRAKFFNYRIAASIAVLILALPMALYMWQQEAGPKIETAPPVQVAANAETAVQKTPGAPVKDESRAYSVPAIPPQPAPAASISQQVNIRVRFAEVSRSDVQTLGIDQFSFKASNFSFGFLGGGKHHNADSLVADLQAKGILNVIAEPNLTAITGQEASFLAGGEVPVPVPAPNGQVTMMYKSFGVSLVFTPTIIKKNRIALHVHPEVSMPSQANAVTYNGVTIPGFSVRRTDTTIEIGSGQTFAIAGLISAAV